MDDPDTRGFADAIRLQLQVVRQWWAPPSPGGFSECRVEPHARHDVERFLHEQRLRETPQHVPLVLFISSHGVLGLSQRHFLRLPATEFGRLLATGMPTNEAVVAALDSHARDVLVILNACHAEGIGAELELWRRDLALDRSRSLNVIATTDTDSQVRALEFATILGRAYERLRDVNEITRPHLTIDEFIEALEDATADTNAELGLTDPEEMLPGPQPVLKSRPGRQPLPTLPNPGYRAQRSLLPPERAELAVPLAELDAWLAPESHRDPLWYLNGRSSLTRSMTEFLHRRAGALIVTGAAATGKSALLARTVTLSEPATRDDATYRRAIDSADDGCVPPAQAVDVAVTARNRGCVSLLEAIATRLPGPPPPPPATGSDPMRHWQDTLAAALRVPDERPLTVVIDAFDEATDPAACLRDVLQPLVTASRGRHRKDPPDITIPAQTTSSHSPTAAGRPLRLVLAVRSNTPHPTEADGNTPDSGLLGQLRTALPAATLLRTDTAAVTQEIPEYVFALLGTASWARTQHERRAEASKEIASLVGRSFLDARLAAQQLIEEGPRQLRDPFWRTRARAGTLGLFQEDLKQIGELDPHGDAVLALLRATAFSLGRGLPWAAIWPATAQALTGRPIPDVDSHIQRLLNGRLAGYLTHDIEDDRRVYRPAHHQLAWLLRHWPTEGETALSQPEQDASPDPAIQLPDPAIQRAHEAITDALAPLAGRDAGKQPHPYLARYLARHAALAGVLDDEHLPPSLLPWVAGDAVRGLLRLPHRGRGNRWWLHAWAAIEPYIQHADLPSRCSSLHLAHTAMRFPGLPAAAMPAGTTALHGSQLRVLWSRWTPPSNVLATVKGRFLAMTALSDGTRQLIALGSETGVVDLLDATTGAVLGDRIRAHDGAVRCLALIPDGVRTVLVSGSTDGTVRIWDAAGRLLIDQLVNRPNWTAALTGYRAASGEITVIAIDGQGEVMGWNDRDGAYELTSLRPHPAEPSAFATLVTRTRDGRDVLVCAGHTLTVRTTTTGELLAEHALSAAVRTLTGTSVPGQIVAGHHDGTLTFWTLPDTAGDHIPAGDHAITALASLSCDGVHLVAVGRGNSIDLWNLTTRTRAGSLTGHADTVTALHPATGTHDTVLISCSHDNTVRTWTADAVRNALKGAVPAPAALAAASTSTDASSLRLAVSYPAVIQVWNSRTGTSEASMTLPSGRAVTALAWHEHNGVQQLLWASDDFTIRTWQPLAPDTGLRVLPVLGGHQQRIHSLALCTDGTRRLLVSGGDDYTVRLWDLSAGHLLKTWPHEYSVRAVTACTDRSGHVWIASGSADGTVRLWSPDHDLPRRRLRCDQGVINALAIDPRNADGPHLVTAGDDTLRVWNLTHPAGDSTHLRGHTDIIEAVTAWTSPRPRPRAYLASASRDGTVRVWDATTSRCVLQLAVGNRVHTLTAHPGTEPAVTTLTLTGDAGVAVVEVHLEGW
ncbi:WD40 repeat domain-containing protein [Streptomyces sp. NBC_00820]|uniref:WD40 repeat domain-containing protein n=1 Tax=Streptomyces sp. NBC_00820 TaxID=2975842 RepID=UPI002ED4F38F|nr:WD40 repeat domain-containing protein [Streptomyces sp. NBC_00820]